MMNKYTVDYTRSSIHFSVKHMIVSRIHGSFDSFSVQLLTDNANNLCDAQIAIAIDVASISTKDLDRDRHLISSDFFYADLYPKITFNTTQIIELDEHLYDIVGDLTIKDTTHPIHFKTTRIGSEIDSWGHAVISYAASTCIDRRKFNLVYHSILEKSGILVSDDIDIFVEMKVYPL